MVLLGIMEPTVKYPFFKMITLIPHHFDRKPIYEIRGYQNICSNLRFRFVVKVVGETVGGGQF